MPDIKTIILAGGKGTRLAPYTTVLPKPLMPVGDMPILEIVIRQLRHYGFRDITVSVGHLAELLMAFFGDGGKWGVKIQYVVEDQPLGTIGPTRLIENLTTPFMVMNGDLLTDIDYQKLYAYHVAGGQSAAVATATREVQISLGVLDVDADRRLVGFREKPRSSFQVSMGIYMFNPSIVNYVPPAVNYGFDKLMLDMLAAKDPVRSYPFDGLWLDIGRHEDYALATDEFDRHRNRFLPGTAGE